MFLELTAAFFSGVCGLQCVPVASDFRKRYQHCCDIIPFIGDVISSAYLSSDIMPPVAYPPNKAHIAFWGLWGGSVKVTR